MNTTIPELQTERLVLRGFVASDVDAFAEIVTDPEVVRYIDDGDPIDYEQCWRGIALFIGHWTLRGYGWWAAEERATGAFLGRIGLYNPAGWPGLEIGWMLRRDAWGRGLATEGARVALDFAFDVVGADQVVSLIDPNNVRSIRVAEKIGERYEDEMTHDGRRVVRYGVTRAAHLARTLRAGWVRKEGHPCGWPCSCWLYW